MMQAVTVNLVMTMGVVLMSPIVLTSVTKPHDTLPLGQAYSILPFEAGTRPALRGERAIML